MADYADLTQAEAALADPALDPLDLAAIAHAQPTLRVAAARHPAAYPGLLDWLRRVGDENIQAAVGARGAIRPVIIPATPAPVAGPEPTSPTRAGTPPPIGAGPTSAIAPGAATPPAIAAGLGGRPASHVATPPAGAPAIDAAPRGEGPPGVGSQPAPWARNDTPPVAEALTFVAPPGFTDLDHFNPTPPAPGSPVPPELMPVPTATPGPSQRKFQLPRPFGLPAFALPAAAAVVVVALATALVIGLTRGGSPTLTEEQFERFANVTLPAQFSGSAVTVAEAGPNLMFNMCPNAEALGADQLARAAVLVSGQATFDAYLYADAKRAAALAESWGDCLTELESESAPAADETIDGVRVRVWDVFFFGALGFADYGNVAVMFDPATAGSRDSVAAALKAAVDQATS
jgi:hypothetical protein